MSIVNQIFMPLCKDEQRLNHQFKLKLGQEVFFQDTRTREFLKGKVESRHIRQQLIGDVTQTIVEYHVSNQLDQRHIASALFTENELGKTFFDTKQGCLDSIVFN